MTNQLYPAFFRLDRLQLLVVGAGAVGEEKLRFILKSSPNARVVIVAPWMGEDLRTLLEGYQYRACQKDMAGSQVRSKDRKAMQELMLRDDDSFQFDVAKLRKLGQFQLHDTHFSIAESDVFAGLYLTPEGGSVTYLKREFRAEDVEDADLIVAATDIQDVNHAVYTAAKAHRRLCNIADTPSLCDFYLGSIVTRGPLKVAISTNGQSPTFAKRFRQFLEAELPQFETTNLLDNLKVFRDRLTGDFAAKVRQLNAATSNLLSAANENKGCACPPGECLVEAASSPPAAPSPDTAPIGYAQGPPAPAAEAPHSNKED